MRFFVVCCIIAAVGGASGVSAQLTPVYTATVPTLPGTMGEVNSMSYDPGTDAVYMGTGAAGGPIIKLASATTMTVGMATPAWTYSILAGGDTQGAASLTEVGATTARFNYPRSISPYLYRYYNPSASNPYAFIGIFVADASNYVVRFINMQINTVTTVAGNTVVGGADGFGQAATMGVVYGITIGRFPTATVQQNLSSIEMTTMVLWGDGGQGCIRQGIPTDSGTLQPTGATSALSTMILDVKTFAGVCAASTTGTNYGPVYNTPGMFTYIANIHLVNPFPNLTVTNKLITPVILIVSDYNNNRVVYITPLFPATSRYSSPLFGGTFLYLYSSTVARVTAAASLGGGMYGCTMELFVAQDTQNPVWVSIPMRYNITSGNITNTTGSTVAPLGSTIMNTKFTALIPYAGSTVGTLVLFSGMQGGVLSYYCCLGTEYSQRIWPEATVEGIPLPLGPVFTASAPALPTATTNLHKMLYDPGTDAVYVANSNQQYVMKIAGASTLPVGTNSPAWTYSIFVGADGSSGGPVSLTEVIATAARFSGLMGIWSFPKRFIDPSLADPDAFAGIFLGDLYHNVVRFVNFQRANNVTTVACNSVAGNTDGLGQNATCFSPMFGTVGRFPTTTVQQNNYVTGATTIVLWGDTSNNCIRQGIPIDNATLLPVASMSSLSNLVLNVTKFVGACTTTQGMGIGLAYNAVGMFTSIDDIVFVNPFPSITVTNPLTTPVLLLVADYIANRIVYITPLFPANARYAAALYSSFRVWGVTVARVTSAVSLGGTLYSSTMELYVTPDSQLTMSIVLPLQYDTQGAGSPTINATGSVTTTLVTNTMLNTRHTLLLPNTAKNGTLLLFTGLTNAVLEYYCCLGTEYSQRIWAEATSIPPPVGPVYTAPTPALSTTTTELNKMIYDPSTDSVYIANAARSYIVKLAAASTLPVGTNNPAWTYSILAGADAAGTASLTEVSATVARFNGVRGIWGCANRFLNASSVQLNAFAGIWVADLYNHAIRFINFQNANKVTTVACSTVAGGADGLGQAATCNNPFAVTMGRFPSATVQQYPRAVGTTSIVFWADTGFNCIRQGIPIDSGTLQPITSTASLSTMVLDVKTFVGACSSTTGSAVGLAYNTAGLFSGIDDIALVNPFPNITVTNPLTTPVLLLVADSVSNRVVYITPLFPATARYVAALYSSKAWGITVARVTTPVSMGGKLYSSTMELYASPDSNAPKLLSLPMQYNGTGSPTINVAGATFSTLATTVMTNSRFTLLVPYAGSTNGTLLLFSGLNGAVLEYYCCLGTAYSQDISSEASVVHVPTVSRRLSISKTGRLTLSKTINYTLSRGTLSTTGTLTATWSRSNLVTATRASMSFSVTITDSASSSVTLSRRLLPTRTSSPTSTRTDSVSRRVLPTRTSSMTPTLSVTASQRLRPTRTVTTTSTDSLSLSARRSITAIITSTIARNRTISFRVPATHTASLRIPLSIRSPFCDASANSTVNRSAYLVDTLGSCCVEEEVQTSTGLAGNCTARLSACVRNLTAQMCISGNRSANASAWVFNCSTVYMDCMVAAAFSVGADAATHRRCPFAAQLQREVNDAYSATDYSFTDLRASCLEAVRNISVDVATAAFGACAPVSADVVNATLGLVQNGTLMPRKHLAYLQAGLCSGMSKANQGMLLKQLNVSATVVSLAGSTLSTFPSLRLQSDPITAQCNLCEAATLAATIDGDSKLKGMVVLESEAVKPTADAGVKAAAATGCGRECPAGQYRSTIGGLASPSAMGAPQYDTCRRGMFNLTLCSDTPGLGMFAVQQTTPSERRQGTSGCNPHPETGRCECPPLTQQFTFPSARWAASSGGTQLVAFNISLCLSGAEAFLFAMPGGRGERSALFGAVASNVDTTAPTFSLLNRPANSLCVAANNRTTLCECRYNASMASATIPTLTAIPLVYFNASTGTSMASVMLVCWGSTVAEVSTVASALTTASTVGSIVGAVMGGPAAAAMQASDLIGGVDCTKLQRAQVAKTSAAVPVRIGKSQLGGIYFLAAIVFGAGVLHGLVALVLSIKKLRSESNAGRHRSVIISGACGTVMFPALTLRVWLLCFQGISFESVRVLAEAYNVSEDTAQFLISLLEWEVGVVVLAAAWCLGVFVLIIVVGRYISGVQQTAIDENEQFLNKDNSKNDNDAALDQAVANTTVANDEADIHVAGKSLEEEEAVTSTHAEMNLDDVLVGDEHNHTAHNESTTVTIQPDSVDAHEAVDDPKKVSQDEEEEEEIDLDQVMVHQLSTLPPPPEGADGRAEAYRRIRSLTGPYVLYDASVLEGVPGPLRYLLAAGNWPTTTSHANAMWATFYGSFLPRATGYGAGMLLVIQAMLVASFAAPPADLKQCVAFFTTLASSLFAVALFVFVVRPFRWPLDNLLAGIMIVITALLSLSTAVPERVAPNLKEGLSTSMMVVAVSSIVVTVLHVALEVGVLQRRQRKGDLAAAKLLLPLMPILPSIDDAMGSEVAGVEHDEERIVVPCDVEAHDGHATETIMVSGGTSADASLSRNPLEGVCPAN